MDGIGTYVTITLAIIGIVGTIVLLRHWRQAVVSNRRMYYMMLACGIDEHTARNADRLLDIDMKDARRRCRRCPDPRTCDRWLNGEAVPGNDFCPNADRFMATVEAGRRSINYEPERRPGRRLDQ